MNIAANHLQLRAAAITRRDGSILLHRCADDDFWALPGGRVENGEDGATAVIRELREELGVSAKVAGLSMIVENFFLLSERNIHEVGFYFNVTLLDDSVLANTSGPFYGNEGNRMVFQWIPLNALHEYDVRPAFLRFALVQEHAIIKHLVCRDGTVFNSPLETVAPCRSA